MLKAFIIGLALMIIAGQLPKLFGIESAGHNFFTKIGHLLANLDPHEQVELVIGVVSLALVLVSRAVAPS